MLDIEARLARQGIGIAVDKAMEDVKGNARRSIRNLVDLGTLFSKSENQKWFFTAARKVIDNPQNPYRALVSRAVRDIDGDTIRRVGLNLGYNALVHGAKKLRRRPDARLPWLLDMTAHGASAGPRLDACLTEGEEMGIYAYALHPDGAEALDAALDVGQKHGDGFCALRLSAELLEGDAPRRIARIHNVAVAVELAPDPERAEGAFRRLRENRCFFGFFLTYGDKDLQSVTSPRFIRRAIGAGCFFGAYQAAGASQQAQDCIHAFAQRLRGEAGMPLVALDWPRDVRETGEKLGVGGVQNLDLAAAPAARCQSGRRGALAEMLLRTRVCPSS
jgi:hypothetical protein